MAQSIPLYDRPDFFANYLGLPRQQFGHDGAPEWPTLREMVGEVRNQKVLDLACGLGWFARYAIESGATSVQAADISTKMIAKAEELTAQELQDRIQYRVADLNDIELESNTYDLVYSSLALHYLPNASFTRLLAQIHDSLKPGGRFVFSAEHPIYTAPSNPALQKLPDGSEVWPLNWYADEGLRETNWLGGVRKYHRTMTTYMRGLLGAGFELRDFVEWMATKKDVSMYPEWRGEKERPMFLLVKVEKLK
ncbi:methyltransferase type 11 [Trematosphaeria pertusa]|uniref:Methyltransferase type 11 n=1 Tax=Trematosphaeria pertusa TaxID=390896 RepID=A0A6A6IMX8_9PLEO|nr:methyltransferase type 11 [Trematosphaeria pertusa]KAF2250930.1 methyltransferase type 11 [Trematosphaeria pertusa]